MMTLACDCEEGMGLPHDHLRKWGCFKAEQQLNSTGNGIVLVFERETDVDDPMGVWTSIPIKDQVKILVDWPKVAKELIRGNP